MDEVEVPGLRVFVISSSQLGARPEDTGNAIGLMSGPAVRHYWDGDRRVGAAVQRTIPVLDAPAWDFWMLYAPGTTWGADGAPEPAWWEHQLSSLSHDYPERLLDASRFAAKALELAGTEKTPDLLPNRPSASPPPAAAVFRHQANTRQLATTRAAHGAPADVSILASKRGAASRVPMLANR